MIDLKALEKKQEEIIFKKSRLEEIIKLRAEIKLLEIQQEQEIISSQFFKFPQGVL